MVQGLRIKLRVFSALRRLLQLPLTLRLQGYPESISLEARRCIQTVSMILQNLAGALRKASECGAISGSFLEVANPGQERYREVPQDQSRLCIERLQFRNAHWQSFLLCSLRRQWHLGRRTTLLSLRITPGMHSKIARAHLRCFLVCTSWQASSTGRLRCSR